jgi:hypothetical protein
MRPFTVSLVLVLIAVIIWVLAAAHVAAPLDLIALGLVFFGASFIVT